MPHTKPETKPKSASNASDGTAPPATKVRKPHRWRSGTKRRMTIKRLITATKPCSQLAPVEHTIAYEMDCHMLGNVPRRKSRQFTETVREWAEKKAAEVCSVAASMLALSTTKRLSGRHIRMAARLVLKEHVPMRYSETDDGITEAHASNKHERVQQVAEGTPA